MYQNAPDTKSASTAEISDAHPQVARPQAPGPEERFTYSFKSLFTLADVAAKRRANVSFKIRTTKTDENEITGEEVLGSASLKRSKSSGDVAVVLGESSRRTNCALATNKSGPGAKSLKATRNRAATTPPSTPSKIPKAKSAAGLRTSNPSIDDNPDSDLSDTDALSVEDAVFVMVTPPKRSKKHLTLAAHTPSLPRIASPFSPRTEQSCDFSNQPPRVCPASPRSGTGHTSASLHLTKSHWELRYDTWVRSLRKPPVPLTADDSELSFQRSRSTERLENPALFPRAGSLTPTALRPVLDGMVASEDARPAIEVDWAMRAWPLDKIQRAIFMHDMDVRTWFPIADNGDELEKKELQEKEGEMESEQPHIGRIPAEEDGEQNNEQLRRWEWDWELRWRVIESMAEDAADREHCEYDVFLAEDDEHEGGDCAYAGCDVQEKQGPEVMVDGEWDCREDAMEVDEIL